LKNQIITQFASNFAIAINLGGAFVFFVAFSKYKHRRELAGAIMFSLAALALLVSELAS